MRDALIELLTFLDNDPVSGRLLVVETFGAGHKALARSKNVLAQVIEAVEEGQGEAKGSEPSPLTGEGIVGAVIAVISGRIVESDSRPLIELTNPLMSMIVLPYLGPAAARRELGRPLPKTSSQQIVRAMRDPLRDIEMRLTYRTVRVLIGLHDHPGASNRQVGEAAGISDQGQISKLLTRLTRLGLIRNTVGGAPGRGAPNAWELTVKGNEVQESLRAGVQG